MSRELQALQKDKDVKQVELQDSRIYISNEAFIEQDVLNAIDG